MFQGAMDNGKTRTEEKGGTIVSGTTLQKTEDRTSRITYTGREKRRRDKK